MIHFIFFFCLFAVYFLFHFRKKPNRKKEIIAMAIIMFLFGALRDKSVGVDVHTYYDYYTYCIDVPFNNFFSIDTVGRFYSKDTGFYIFLKILTYISKNPQFMLVVISGIFSISFAYFAFNQKGDSFVIFTMFIAFRIFAFTLTGLRETMSLSFVLIAICLLQQKKRIKASIFTIIGSAFHLSALVFFAAIATSFVKKYKLFAALIMSLVFVNLISGNQILYLLSQVLLNGRYAHYGESALLQSISFSSTFILFVIFYFIVLLSTNELEKEFNNIHIDMNIITLGVAFSIMGMGIDNIFRIAYYFIIPLFSMFDISLERRLNKKDVFLLKPLICIFLIAQYILLGPGAGITDYNFFWK